MSAARPGVRFDAPRFPVEASLRDPVRGAAEAETRRRQAGYEDGYRDGIAAAEAEVCAAIDDHRRSADRLTGLSTALERAVGDMEARDRLALAEIEPDVVALAVQLAIELVGRELAVTDEPVRDAIERVVGLVPARGTPVLFVHPDDAATAREAVDLDIARWNGAVTVTADPRVERGGCVVEVGACRIDGQLGPALERMVAVLDGSDLLLSAGAPGPLGPSDATGDLLADRDDPAQSRS